MGLFLAWGFGTGYPCYERLACWRVLANDGCYGNEPQCRAHGIDEALHELRGVAHVIDMHQLTKDPRGMKFKAIATASSPERTLTPFQLTRYLDYCS